MQHLFNIKDITGMANQIKHTALTICCVVMLSSIKSQDSSKKENDVYTHPSPYISAVANKIAAYSEKGQPIFLNDINSKAVSDLKQRYKNVDNETWQKREKGYIASFKKDGISYEIGYSKRGKWENSIKAYTEDKLPFAVRDIVKRNYYDFTISYVKEIETLLSQEIPTYLVYIYYKNQSKIIRVKDGEMDVWLEVENRLK